MAQKSRTQINIGNVDEDDMLSLWEFQKRLEALGHIKTDYQNTDKLESHFKQQLDKCFASGGGERDPKDPEPDPSPDTTDQVVGYLRWLCERTEYIELRGIERAGGSPVVLLPLQAAYVPLRARPMARPGDGQGAKLAQHGSSDIDLDQVLGLGNRLVIIGGPGSGKTTVLLHMAWALASSLLSGQAEPARSRLGLAIPASELPLPILVPLASFARYCRGLKPDALPHGKTLAHFISYHLISKQAGAFDLAADFFVQLREERQVILLLDGLDEVANEDQRAQVREAVEEFVAGHDAWCDAMRVRGHNAMPKRVRGHNAMPMCVVVTCRTIAYRSGRTALGANFREIEVQPLDLEQHVTPMVQQAYACIHRHDAALRAERVQDLLSGIQRLENDRRARLGLDAALLVDSPLMVRLLLIVHVNNRTLPDGRAELFDKAINALLQVDYGREQANISELATDWKLYRDMAQHLAFHMHQQGPDQGREIDERSLRTALRGEAEFARQVEDFLSHARQRGSVLEERQGAYRFIHLAFQEFLVARSLREVTGGESREAILCFLDARLADPWWREPILLLAGYWASTSARSARDFLAALARAGGDPNARFSAAELAGRAALELREGGEPVRADCARRFVELLRDQAALIGAQPVIRARAGDWLSQLGDPRFDPQRFWLPADDMLGLERIAADPEFRIGTRQADAQRVATIAGRDVSAYEINDTLTPTPEFFIARYPTTVAQFRAFVEATGFEIGDADALRDPDSRPVRRVSWHEAIAYCEWLNEMLAGSPQFQGSKAAGLVRHGQWRVALPSELEWEKAARGGLRDAVFSWGDAPDPVRANYRDSEIGSTSVVGCFPGNGFDLHDMIGNLFEWTSSPNKPYPYRADDGREHLDAGKDVRQFVRGGSWGSNHGSARCAYRRGDHPDSRDVVLGFRVVLRSAPDA